MSHTDYRILLDRGRKAGLKTSELYTALSSRPPEASDFSRGHADGNGFVPSYNARGQRVFLPGDKSA
jgi:hypothetical protein